MAIGMSELKKGLKIEIDGIPYRITEYQHVKPGKGAAFVRAKIKSFLDGLSRWWCVPIYGYDHL